MVRKTNPKPKRGRLHVRMPAARCAKIAAEAEWLGQPVSTYVERILFNMTEQQRGKLAERSSA